ncbi:MAG: VOC family protein [Actinobacteria bacterium]|nr:VOC family protein [Actinomycetota bacterium]
MQPGLIGSNIILYCGRWAETVGFYREGLQLPVCFSTDWFVEFSLTETSRLSVADEKRACIRSSGGTGITLTLQVVDLEAAWGQAELADLAPTPIETHPWGARVFRMLDPEGHRIEFWESAGG